MFSLFVTLLVFAITFLLVYDWQKHSYWKTRGVPCPTYLPLIGHIHYLLWGFHWESISKAYKKFKSNGFWGMYEGFTPACYICDPSYIRDIMVKDADHFLDQREITLIGETKIFTEMLFMVNGEKWKALRSLISPTFTTGKIKAMFPLIDEKANEFVQECGVQMKEKSFVEAKSLFVYYGMDVIASCAFGIDIHCMEQENSAFVRHAIPLTVFDFKKTLKALITNVFPRIAKTLRLQSENDDDVQFLCKMVEETVALRRKSGVRRGDFLDLMLDALAEREAKGDDFKYPMTLYTVKAQSLMFLVAGFDTTSNTLAFLIYLLAKHPTEQEKLHQELRKIVDTHGELDYHNVMEAPYLDACISEALRIFAPAHMTERRCTKKYKLAGTDIEIPKSSMVGIPIWSIHRDPEYWENPLSFIPERFLPENKANIKPYTYMPFGLGPRNCVGMRFAQMKIKLVVARLCLEYKIELRPGFTEVVLAQTIGTLRPNDDGVQVVLKKY